MTMIKSYPFRKAAMRGDTWDGYTIEFVGVDLTGATVSTSIKALGQTQDFYPPLTIGSGMSFVGDPANGTVRVNQILNLNWKPGTYTLETQYVLANGVTRTRPKRTLIVEDDDNK